MKRKVFLDLGLESLSTKIGLRDLTDWDYDKDHVSEYGQRRNDALLAHASVDPESTFWFGLPSGAAAEATLG